MKITMLGAGALGSTMGALLQAAGHDVQFIARGKRAQQLERDGVRITGTAELALACTLVKDVAPSQTPDLLIVAVKTYSHRDAVDSLAHWRPEVAFSVANGVTKNDHLIQAFGADAALGCMADFSAELLADGKVVFTRNVAIHLGELGAGAVTPRVDELVQTLEGAGIRARSHEKVAVVEWSKFVGWCPFMALSVISRGRTWRALSDPNLARTLVTASREMAALASSLGIEIVDVSPLPVASLTRSSLEDAVAELARMGERFRRDAVDHRMSALQDFERGSRLETEETLGHALALGRDRGVPMPTLATFYDLVMGLDRLRS